MRVRFFSVVFIAALAVFQTWGLNAIDSSVSLHMKQTLALGSDWQIWNLFSFIPHVSVPGGYTRWEFAIYGSDDKKVKRIMSYNVVPQEIDWSGTDTSGRLLPDGFYQAKIRVWDSNGNVTESRGIDLIFMIPFGFQTIREAGIVVRGEPPNLILELPGILFGSGNVVPKPGSNDTFRAIADFLKMYPGSLVEIQGHTDNTGAYEVNMDISRGRALTVYNHLVRYGMDPRRLRVRALADRMPIASNLTKEGRQRNRRVEVVMSPA